MQTFSAICGTDSLNYTKCFRSSWYASLSMSYQAYVAYVAAHYAPNSFPCKILISQYGQIKLEVPITNIIND